jgi:hypothetical protein
LSDKRDIDAREEMVFDGSKGYIHNGAERTVPVDAKSFSIL